VAMHAKIASILSQTLVQALPNAIVVLEYILAIAIIANTVSLCSQLGLRVSCTFAPHLTYLPLLWTILGISIHISGAAALWVRTTAMRKRSCASTFQLLRQQFKPLDRHIASDVGFEDESYLYICLSWFTSLLSVSSHLRHACFFQYALHIGQRQLDSNRSIYGFSYLLQSYSYVQALAS
jgi:hypothetical protein